MKIINKESRLNDGDVVLIGKGDRVTIIFNNLSGDCEYLCKNENEELLYINRKNLYNNIPKIYEMSKFFRKGDYVVIRDGFMDTFIARYCSEEHHIVYLERVHKYKYNSDSEFDLFQGEHRIPILCISEIRLATIDEINNSEITNEFNNN